MQNEPWVSLDEIAAHLGVSKDQYCSLKYLHGVFDAAADKLTRLP